MSKNILLLGASLDSDNRGVNALGISAISIIKHNIPESNITLLMVGNKKNRPERVFFDQNEIPVNIAYFPKHDFLKSLGEAVLEKKLRIRNGKMSITELIKTADIAFDINEGDSFSDIYGTKRIVRHFFDSLLILSWKKKLVFLPQTIGPFNTVIGKKMGLFILQRVTKIYVRDLKANELLQKYNLKHQLEIDMAVHMQPTESTFKVDSGTVGININGLMYFNRYGSMAGQYDAYETFIFKLTKTFIDKGNEVLLIPHTYNYFNPNEEDDLMAIKDFVKKHNDTFSGLKYLDWDCSAQEIKGIISKLDFFLGSRMHSCIAALSSSVPCIGLAYSYKFSGTFGMFNFGNHVFDLKDLNESDIDITINNILELYELREKSRQNLKRVNERKILKLNL